MGTVGVASNIRNKLDEPSYHFWCGFIRPHRDIPADEQKTDRLQ